MKKIFKKENIFTLVFIIVALHPIIELDYLVGDKLPIPRLTTIIDFLVLPLLVVLAFWFNEKNKKKVGLLFGLYILIFGIYFLIHCRNANIIQGSIHLTDNFYFNMKDEIIYTLTLLIPLVYVYVFYLSDIKETLIKKVTIALSCVTSLPIFVSNVFVFGKSTYTGYTIDNFLSWFSLPYSRFWHHPRRYATKFFFEEGNTIGILMLMVLPFLYYFFYREKNNIKKSLLGCLIVIHSLSMIILSTRLATYCSALVPVAMLIIYILLMLLKKEKFQVVYVVFLLLVTMMNVLIIPYGPAYQNQLIDADDYVFIKSDENHRTEGKDLLKDADKLDKWGEEWRDFYVYMFEDYQFLMNVTPPIYYTTWYSYEYDPQFWVDLIFDYELEERVNGRQIETIFTKYKWEELTTPQKITGFGYGTFMRGGILIERDFVQQYYSYGPVGVVLIMGLWIVLLAYCGIKLLFGYKQGKWAYLNIITLMSLCLGYLSSYVSGHTFDELTTSMFISLLFGFLVKEVRSKNVEKI
ncbi:MAG: O-antigen ligase family protein [Solobacterium sp.]|nr:O-antigen ligase family protein [Solobacterium sp.]MDY2952097.1 O-antigen ligase family protein [Erysipelotrichaceae bacterium]